jgi:hypothetical protein
MNLRLSDIEWKCLKYSESLNLEILDIQFEFEVYQKLIVNYSIFIWTNEYRKSKNSLAIDIYVE